MGTRLDDIGCCRSARWGQRSSERYEEGVKVKKRVG